MHTHTHTSNIFSTNHKRLHAQTMHTCKYVHLHGTLGSSDPLRVKQQGWLMTKGYLIESSQRLIVIYGKLAGDTMATINTVNHFPFSKHKTTPSTRDWKSKKRDRRRGDISVNEREGDSKHVCLTAWEAERGDWYMVTKLLKVEADVPLIWKCASLQATAHSSTSWPSKPGANALCVTAFDRTSNIRLPPTTFN